MPNIFASNESLNSLPPVVGREVMELINKNPSKRVSLFDVFDAVKDKPWFSTRIVYFALAFLYSAELINFDGLYVSRFDPNAT